MESAVLRSFDEAVQICPVEQKPAQLLASRKRKPHPREMASGIEVADGPRAHSEVRRSRIHIEEARREWARRHCPETGDPIIVGFRASHLGSPCAVGTLVLPRAAGALAQAFSSCRERQAF